MLVASWPMALAYGTGPFFFFLLYSQLVQWCQQITEGYLTVALEVLHNNCTKIV